MEKYLKDCGIYLLLGALSLSLGGYGMECFLSCDYIKFPTDYAKWSNDAGYTVNDFIWFVFGVYGIPVAIASFLILTLQTYKGSYDNFIKFTYLYTMLGFAIWFCALGRKMAFQTFACGIFCIGPLVSSNTTIKSGMKTSQRVMPRNLRIKKKITQFKGVI